jgi:ABC-type transport system substrate-binding protein
MTGALLGPDASYSSWEDETIISMLNEIGTTVDIEERKALYEEFSGIWWRTHLSSTYMNQLPSKLSATMSRTTSLAVQKNTTCGRPGLPNDIT